MSDPDANAAHGPAGGPSRGLRRWRWPLIIAGPVVIVGVVVAFMVVTARYETTDNAYVQVAKTAVAPSISGRVVEIFVHENQPVRRGQPLFKLDPRDFEASADAANAQLAAAELQVRADRAAYGQAQANVGAAREQLAYAEREAKRQRDLAAAGVASRQQVDQAVHAAQQARDELTAAQQAAIRALAALGGDPNLKAEDHPMVMQARAQAERARLDVSYTTVVAPADGVVARVDQLPVGAYLNASQTAFWLLSGKPWIEANFKEDQLAHMKVGQPVDIQIDADPDADLHGHVASFAPGAGSAFSPLPAQNATGNWVKVTQRLPVRIEFDKPPPPMAARAGLSAKVKVYVRASGRDS